MKRNAVRILATMAVLNSSIAFAQGDSSKKFAAAPRKAAETDRHARQSEEQSAQPPGVKPSQPPQGKRARTDLEPKASTGLAALTDFTPEQAYKGRAGGLYGQGRNTPPAEHLAAALQAAKSIQPLDSQGQPDPNGKVAVITNGPSDTKPEFDMFVKVAHNVERLNPRLVLVNTAQGGQEAGDWAFPERRVQKGKPDPWEVQAAKLKQNGVAPAQVQIVWMKQSRRDPATLGEFPKHVEELKKNQADIIRRLKKDFPNLRLVYLSSRTYAGYARNTANPEPHGYEWAWANQWLIQDQIAGNPSLNHDSAQGDVKAPVILWGPYLWTDGVKGRRSDDLVCLADDLREDGMHPSEAGCRKVADQLLQFFQTDPTARTWFLKSN